MQAGRIAQYVEGDLIRIGVARQPCAQRGGRVERAILDEHVVQREDHVRRDRAGSKRCSRVVITAVTLR